MKKLSLLFALFLLASGAVSAAEPARAELVRWLDQVSTAKGSDSERLKSLYDRYWDYLLREFPESATYQGYPGQNDRWTDYSPEALAQRDALAVKMVAALESIDRSRLREDERVHYDLALRRARLGVEGQRFPGELLVINQMAGVQQSVPQLLTIVPHATVEDYEDILARLRAVPALVDQNIALLEKGLAAGVTPPRITLRDLPEQVRNLLAEDPMKSPMLRVFTDFPAAVSAPDRERLTREAVQVYQEKVLPAFRKLHRFLSETYLPGAREAIAMTALPGGQDWYAYNVREITTTDLTPQQIHELGLSEVARLRREMDKVIASTGFQGGFEEFLKFLRTDPRFFFDKPEDLVAAYREIAKRADPELIRLFGKLPRTPYGVEPIPSYMEKSQTTAYYEEGSIKAGRPGYYRVNTYDLKSRPKWEMEALSLHEAVPGHHLQISLAQELENVPEWRKYDGYTAFIEGWALYAESLGEEMGFYQDPYSKFGQLTYEMWRAIRLVVDTGMHTLGWTRDQAIDFFRKNSGKTEHDIVVEIDRYIVWPGQALGYKIGELKIKELRAHAQKELGAKFDLRAFHDQVLANGAVPIDLLEKNVRGWVAARKGAPAETKPAR